MSNFADLINELPMDPADSRFFYAIDFVNAVDDGGTIETPMVTVSTADAAKGVVIGDVSVSGTKVIFRPSVSAGKQNEPNWQEDGDRILVSAQVEDVNTKPIRRSGYLWIAKR